MVKRGPDSRPRHRVAKMITLRLVTAKLTQSLRGLLVLDTLRYDRQAEFTAMVMIVSTSLVGRLGADVLTLSIQSHCERTLEDLDASVIKWR